jgi:GTP pyrophosphokinase
MRGKTTSPVLINGEDDVLTSFAKCCNPLPGEAVSGFITRGRGITIHRENCDQYLNSDDDRKIPVQWQNTDSRHTATLEVACSNQMGILADLGATCKSMNINISHLETVVLSTDEAAVKFSVAIAHIDQITVLLKNVQKIKGVTTVRRV